MMNAILVILDSLRKDHVRAYGNDRIETPNLDALAEGSLIFTRAYPESIPTLPARRAIHTGMRTWPFRDWEPPEGEDFMPAGWQHIPEDRTPLAEFLNLRRCFNAFGWVGVQERDSDRPPARVSQEAGDRLRVPGNPRSMEDKVRQYLANTRDRSSEEDYFAPKVFTMATEFLKTADRGQPFFLVVDCFDPHEPWDPPDEYVSLYSDNFNGPEPTVPEYDDAGWIDEGELERMRRSEEHTSE